MGEGESNTPRSDKYTAEHEGRQFRADIEHESYVQEAGRVMANHADDLESRTKSPMDELIDELIEEQKKPKPDLFRTADIRRRINDEHALVLAQNVSDTNTVQHQADKMETTELDDREAAVSEIVRLIPAITSLGKDITNMADEAIGKTVEEYPDEMEIIINDAAETKEKSIKEVCKYLQIEPAEEFPAVILNTKELLQVKIEILRSVFASLHNAQSEMLDYQTDMTEVVKAWKEEHHQGS